MGSAGTKEPVTGDSATTASTASSAPTSPERQSAMGAGGGGGGTSGETPPTAAKFPSGGLIRQASRSDPNSIHDVTPDLQSMASRIVPKDKLVYARTQSSSSSSPSSSLPTAAEVTGQAARHRGVANMAERHVTEDASHGGHPLGSSSPPMASSSSSWWSSIFGGSVAGTTTSGVDPKDPATHLKHLNLRAEDRPVGSSSSSSSSPSVAGTTSSSSVTPAAGGEHLDEHGVPDILRQGRYKIAQPNTMEYLKASQPNNPMVQKQMEEQMQDMRRYLEETEGLRIGSRRMSELSQQWRFFLASEPVQRGFDAGFLLGTFTAAAGSFLRPVNRKPMKVLWLWMKGFCVGMIGLPASLLVYEQYNMRRIMRREEEMFKTQRQDFFDQLRKKKSSD